MNDTVENFLCRLPVKYQLALDWLDKGLSMRETGRRIGLSVERVRQMRRRAGQEWKKRQQVLAAAARHDFEVEETRTPYMRFKTHAGEHSTSFNFSK